MPTEPRRPNVLKQRLKKIVFESDTAAGRLFDQVLIGAIVLSLVVVILDSVDSISRRYHFPLSVFEWTFTALFSIEYAIRIYCSERKLRYIFSFYGLIDFFAVVPTYLALIFPELHALIDVRVLRLIRIFRIFKLTAYVSEYAHMAEALKASRRKILVFLSVVLMLVMVMGTLMYVIEGPENGYTSIPTGIYWAITTMTTVGFGDITPKTDLGRLLSSVMMLIGWGTLAVPTGIVTAEMSIRSSVQSQRTCPHCKRTNLMLYDKFCGSCGKALDPD